jgi:hypothetical protein
MSEVTEEVLLRNASQANVVLKGINVKGLLPFAPSLKVDQEIGINWVGYFCVSGFCPLL